MRDRVVNVQQVQVLGRRHVVHHGSQSQRVRRMVKQGVVHDFDFVEMDALPRFGHPHRNGVADEVHVVAAGRQFQAQFRCHHAAAAVRRVTRDANFHLRDFGCAARREDFRGAGETSGPFLWPAGRRCSGPNGGRPRGPKCFVCQPLRDFYTVGTERLAGNLFWSCLPFQLAAWRGL